MSFARVDEQVCGIRAATLLTCILHDLGQPLLELNMVQLQSMQLSPAASCVNNDTLQTCSLG